ncbi:transient receptor potential cation channel subfamily M member 3 isoform X16 [Sigmodon hispidus]
MGKKWRDAGEMERACSDREDSAESRRRSRSASRGRFAESWKRLSSKQGSTKRSGLPSQQTPVSDKSGEPQRLLPSSLGFRSTVHGAELALLALEPGELVEPLTRKESPLEEGTCKGRLPFL